MNIEMGESLVASWLKHVKKCQIVQTNWKPSCFWNESEFAFVEEVLRGFNNKYHVFSTKGKGRKKQLDARRIFDGVECDVVGVEFDKCGRGVHFYGMESAFHSDGLHYKDNGRTISAKIVKTVLSLYLYFGAKDIEVGVITPIVNPKQLELVAEKIKDIRVFFRKYVRKFKCAINFYTDYDDEKMRPKIEIKSLRNEVLRPLLRQIPLVDDATEGFLRSMLFRELSLGKLPVRSALRSALRGLKCTPDEMIEKGPQCMNDIANPNLKSAISTYFKWLDDNKDFTDSAQRVPSREEVKNNKRQKPRKGAKMAYKKPQIVAKSAAKQSFVAGCVFNCRTVNGVKCETTKLK